MFERVTNKEEESKGTRKTNEGRGRGKKRQEEQGREDKRGKEEGVESKRKKERV